MYYLRLWILVKAFNRTRNKGRYFSHMPPNTSTTSRERQAVSRQGKDVSLSSQHITIQSTTPTRAMNKAKGEQYPRKKYLSEEIIRNSSDESEEEDVRLTSTSLDEHKVSDVQIHQNAPSVDEHSYRVKARSVGGSENNSSRITSVSRPSGRRKLIRQRTGACKSCQGRHQRCDRVHPICGRCAELGLVCEFSEASTAQSAQPSFGVTDSEHDPKGYSKSNNTKPLTTSNFRFDKYWDNAYWRLFLLEGDERETTLATMRSLGLRATSRDFTNYEFDIESFESLGKAIDEIARRLSRQSSASQLLYHAEDRTYLDEEIDALLDAHSSIWSLDADRSKLLAPGTDENYLEDLVYEESEDQKL